MSGHCPVADARKKLVLGKQHAQISFKVYSFLYVSSMGHPHRHFRLSLWLISKKNIKKRLSRCWRPVADATGFARIRIKFEPAILFTYNWAQYVLNHMLYRYNVGLQCTVCTWDRFFYWEKVLIFHCQYVSRCWRLVFWSQQAQFLFKSYIFLYVSSMA